MSTKNDRVQQIVKDGRLEAHKHDPDIDAKEMISPLFYNILNGQFF